MREKSGIGMIVFGGFITFIFGLLTIVFQMWIMPPSEILQLTAETSRTAPQPEDDRVPTVVIVTAIPTAFVPTQPASPIPTVTPSLNEEVAFCLQEPSAASAYACAQPVSHLPSGISKFFYSRSFANIPIGTQIYSRWYWNGALIPALERTITYTGKWVTPTGFQYSWVQEVPGQLELYDGLYTVEIFLVGQSTPIQTGAVRIGS